MALARKPRSATWPILIGILVVAIASTIRLGLNAGDLSDAFSNVRDYVQRFFPPQLSTAHYYGKFLFESVAMAIWGTSVAFVLAAISTLGGARNFAPHALVNRGVRAAMNLCRLVPDLILAIIFVSAFGPGPLAGVLTISISSFGQLGKMWNDSLERLPVGCYEGVAAAGGHGFQMLRFCGWPSVTREALGFTLYTFDRALREAVIIGAVGAGGIGMELSLDLRLFEFQRAAVVILMIAALLISSETVSGMLRKRLA